jgi:DNA-directed RNA polymerase specialized sigma24 family protein
MKRRDGQGGENVKRVLDENRDELMWVAEVMAGSRPAGEQCLAEAIELADAARYIGNEWMLSWIKRLLVHVALKRMSGEIRELLPSGNAPIAASPAPAEPETRDREKLRSIPPQRLVASLDVLERACLVLHVYLGYSVLDCALLLGSPRAWIEPICNRVLRKIIADDQSSHGECRRFHSFVSLRVMECAG